MSKSWKEMYEDAIRARRDDMARMAAIEAKCCELQGKYDQAAVIIAEIVALVPLSETIEVAKTGKTLVDWLKSKLTPPETACEHHWMPATQAGSLAIIGRGCSKCGAWETSPEPNYRFQEPSNLPSQSMTIGAHPGGGPCIHVWALTNRDAVENGRCGICGQSVANRSVKP